MPKAIGGLIEDVFQNGFQKVFGDENWNEGINVPVNIKETDTTYEMHLMAPGLKKEEFKLNVDKNVLHVTYDHKEETTEGVPSDKWLRKEYKLRTFRRSFTLNDKVNIQEISAKYNDGVLVVTLPKKEPAQPATQEITVD
jgi:HSP20 family protein